MVPRVVAKEDHNTHHISLYDGTNTMGLKLHQPNVNNPQYDPIPGSGVQMYSGTQEYQDTPPPWFPTQMDDWSMGRGVETFYKNSSGYYDGFCAWTNKEGELINGGHDTWMTGLHQGNQLWPRHVSGNTVTYYDYGLATPTPLYYPYIAIKFTVDASGYSALYIDFLPKKKGTPANDLTIAIWKDSGGSPDSEIVTTTLAASSLGLQSSNIPTRVTIASTALTAATDYWLVFRSAGGTASNGWYVGSADTAATSKVSTDGVSWSAGSKDPFYRISPAYNDYEVFFEEYKGAMYAAIKYDNASVSKLFINGDQGLATGTHSTTTLQDTSKTWTADEWIGCLVKIVEGTGSTQPQPWRQITTNTTNTLTVSPAWDVTPVAASSLYVILASDKWTAVTGHDWATDTDVVTDMFTANGIMYMCHGDGNNATSFRKYTDTDVLTIDWGDEGDMQYGKGVAFSDQEGSYILATKIGVPGKWNYATAVDGTSTTTATHTDLAFQTTDLSAGDLGERIRSVNIGGEYGEPWLFKESSVQRIINKKAYQIQIPEMGNTRDDRNGIASLAHGIYMYFTWHDTILRYYLNNLDNIGPNKAEYGLPSDRQGTPVTMDGYPGLVIVGYDGGIDNYSHVMAYNMFGWFELWRAPAVGRRVRKIKVQSIPGNHVDRLYINCGSDILWIPLSIDPYNHPDVDYNFYPFARTSYIISPYIYLKRRSTEKLFKSIQVILDSSSAGKVFVSYRTDATTTWTYLGLFDSFRDAETDFSSTYNITGSRIQLLFALEPTNNNASTKIVAALVKAFAKVEKNYRLIMNVVVEDDADDLLGRPDTSYATFSTKDTLLNTWDGSPTALLVRAQDEPFDNKYFVLDKGGYRILRSISETQALAQLTLYEL